MQILVVVVQKVEIFLISPSTLCIPALYIVVLKPTSMLVGTYSGTIVPMGTMQRGCATLFAMYMMLMMMVSLQKRIVMILIHKRPMIVMVTVFQAFPEGRRGAALGVYVMGLVGAASVGPPLGGLAIEFFNWRYIYYAPLILVAISFPLGMLFMPNVREEKPPKFDWLGYALICLALYCLMTGVSNGPREGWSSDYIVMLLIVGVAAMIAFIQSQRRAAASMLDLSLFRNKMFTMAVIVTCFSAVGNFASVYAVPVVVEDVLGEMLGVGARERYTPG